MTLQPAAQVLSSDIGSGATLNSVRNFVLKLPLPTNATLNTFVLTAGFGYGGTPTIAIESGKLVMRVPGPVNVEHELPAAEDHHEPDRVRCRACRTSRPGSTARATTTRGLQFLVNVTLPSPLGNADLQTDCYPTASTPLSSTQILPFDTARRPSRSPRRPTAPSSPRASSVNASYSCNDGPFGIGVATCVGTGPERVADRHRDRRAEDVHGHLDRHRRQRTEQRDRQLHRRRRSRRRRRRARGPTRRRSGVMPFRVRLLRPANEVTTVNYTTEDGERDRGE